MSDDLDMRRRRAAYRASHRGTKEMDFILGRYAEAHLPAMSPAELSQFEQLLALPDPLLAEWFAHGNATPELAHWIGALRTFHGLTVVE